MDSEHLPPDFFGDPFVLETLPLPRPATGYAVQCLGTDLLLDAQSGLFLSMRSPELAGLFVSHKAAHAAASRWLRERKTDQAASELAIVPASYDQERKRHILILGVLKAGLDDQVISSIQAC